MNAQQSNRYFELHKTLHKLLGAVENRIFDIYKNKNFRGIGVRPDDQKKIANLTQKKMYVRQQVQLLKEMQERGEVGPRFGKFERKIERLGRYVFRQNYGVNIVSTSLLDKSLHVSQISISESM